MEIQQVLTILDSVAAGTDPTTGGEVIRALETASALLRQRAATPIAAGSRWTEEEDARLCREFDEGRPIGEIARLHGRSRSAINLRLVKLGRVEADAVRMRERG